MAAASSAGLPVPRVYAEGIWRGRPVLHMSWMPGRPLRDELRAHPWHARALGVEFGRSQAAVHAISPPAALLAHSTPWIAWANPDDALRDCLRAAARGPDVLLHLDFHPMNVLVVDGRVSAVLDWANARAGDPRADLARTASILRFAPLDAGVPRSLENLVRRLFSRGLASRLPGGRRASGWHGAVLRLGRGGHGPRLDTAVGAARSAVAGSPIPGAGSAVGGPLAGARGLRDVMSRAGRVRRQLFDLALLTSSGESSRDSGSRPYRSSTRPG